MSAGEVLVLLMLAVGLAPLAMLLRPYNGPGYTEADVAAQMAAGERDAAERRAWAHANGIIVDGER